MTLTIIDYGVGNLNSVANMIRHVGGKCLVSDDFQQVSKADKLILPGVGTFDFGMDSLRRSGLIDALKIAVLERKVPVLGICLGMQLMMEKSEEGFLAGLGWIGGYVKKFAFDSTDLKIPHMGWNELDILRPNSLIIQDEPGQRFYFVHSYHVVCSNQNDIAATCSYGYDFTASFAHENIFGVQFHPEKSHRFGMSLMKRFVEI